MKHRYLPATSRTSVSDKTKNSIASLEASGEGALCEGGVGKEAEGGEKDIRESKGSELGPSDTYCASTKHAVAMTRGGYSTHNGVRYLRRKKN